VLIPKPNATRECRRQAARGSLGWGLVRFWAKDIKDGFANIQAKAEGMAFARSVSASAQLCR